MTKKKAIIFIVVALLLGIAIGVGVTLGISSGRNTGTASTLDSAEVQELKQAYEDKCDEVDELQEKVTAVSKLSQDLLTLTDETSGSISLDDSTLTDILDRCDTYGISTEAYRQNDFLSHDDLTALYDAVLEKYTDLQNEYMKAMTELFEIKDEYINAKLDVYSIEDHDIKTISDDFSTKLEDLGDVAFG